MKHNRMSEEELKNLLQQMPAIKDKQDPEELFQKISSRIDEHEKKSFFSNKQWLFPSLASLAVVVILVIISPSLFNNNLSQDQAGSEMSRMDKASSPEIMQPNNDTSMKKADNNALSKNKQSNLGIAQDNGVGEQGFASIQMMPQSHTIQQEPAQTDLITAVVPDLQGQYLVPVSFLFPKGQRTLQEHYNHLMDYIQENEWGLDDSVFANLNFELLNDQKTVKVKVNNDFQLNSSSSSEYVFLTSLKDTFRPQGFETLDFDKGQEAGIELSQYGYMDKTPINTEEKHAYKLYQAADDKPSFLASIPMDVNATFEDAIAKMKADEPEFHVKGVIPVNVAIDKIGEDNELLTISFSDKSQLINNQEFVNMFDALMMTAKSFGYKKVQFENANLERIGTYQLNQIIEVPVAVNSMPAVVSLDGNNDKLEEVK